LGNGRTVDLARGMLIDSQMARARAGFEFPVKTFTK
jgi:hypothetical protein